MDRAAVLKRLDEERRSVARGGEVLEITAVVTRVLSPYRAIPFAIIDQSTADEVIAAEVEHHRRQGLSFEWLCYAHDNPPDMLDRLRRHGFEIGPREEVLVFDLAGPREWIERADVRHVLRVDSPEKLDVFRRLAEAIFSKDYALTTKDLRRALGEGSADHRAYIAYAGDEPVSIGRLYLNPNSIFGGLYGGGTLPAFRGRGFYRAVVAARARDAIASGARFLMVDSLPTSQPILKRLGFQRLTDTWPCEWRPESERTSLLERV